MHGLQDAMLLFVYLCNSGSGRSAPGKEDNAISTNSSNEINYLLCKLLPALVGMTVGLVGTNSKASIKHQDAALSPRYE